jgi:tRNA threonylcarbamoyladenosine modification (KEOPS) complex Cgi121 subunit
MAGVQLLCYSNVANGVVIQTILSESKWKHVVIDLRNVVSAYHIMVAVTKSLVNEAQGSMKTTDFKSEVLYSLSVSGRITEAVSQFCAKEENCSIAVAIVHQYEAGKEELSARDISLSDDVATAAAVDAMIGLGGRREDPAALFLPLAADKLAALKACYKLTNDEVDGQTYSQIEQMIITKVAVKNL